MLDLASIDSFVLRGDAARSRTPHKHHKSSNASEQRFRGTICPSQNSTARDPVVRMREISFYLPLTPLCILPHRLRRRAETFRSLHARNREARSSGLEIVNGFSCDSPREPRISCSLGREARGRGYVWSLLIHLPPVIIPARVCHCHLSLSPLHPLAPLPEYYPSKF